MNLLNGLLSLYTLFWWIKKTRPELPPALEKAVVWTNMPRFQAPRSAAPSTCKAKVIAAKMKGRWKQQPGREFFTNSFPNSSQTLLTRTKKAIRLSIYIQAYLKSSWNSLLAKKGTGCLTGAERGRLCPGKTYPWPEQAQGERRCSTNSPRNMNGRPPRIRRRVTGNGRTRWKAGRLAPARVTLLASRNRSAGSGSLAARQTGCSLAHCSVSESGCREPGAEAARPKVGSARWC